MRASRGEPVEVWLRSGRPARFVWRGRMHTVMFVLDRQVSQAAEAGPAAGDGGETECWRVEATPERTVPPTVYELCRDVTSGRWLLSRG
jgi:hypothetical protein